MSRPWQEAKKYKQVIDHQLIEIRQTERGRGIFSLVDHKKGDLVAAFTGKPIAIPSFDSEEAADAFSKSTDGEYAMSYAWDEANGAHLAISPDVSKIGGHIANHSCNPNTSVREKQRDALLMRARRPINAGEEITVDYHWQRRVPIPCLCGSDPCTGNIGLTFTLADVPTDDGTINTYLNFDRHQIVRLLRVAEAHRNIDALRVLFVRGKLMRAEKLLEYFDEAFGSRRRDAWLSQNFHTLA
ncbi:MAG: SET domain-containing protein [Polyangiaceae bacterium]